MKTSLQHLWLWFWFWFWLMESCIVLIGVTAPSAHAFGPAPSDNGERGVYFYKKTYVPEPIPSFEEAEAGLPVPVLDDHPDWVRLYWAAWTMAFDHFRAPPVGSPLVSNYVDAAFSSHLFQWDTLFMLPFMSYADAIFPAIQSLDNFYARQHDSGYIDREIVASSGADYVFGDLDNTINPPLFAWAEVEHARRTGDLSRYSEVYEPLVQYSAYLENARRSTHSRHQLYWNKGLGSGMDNAPRGGSGWVDMSSQMVIMYRSLSNIALALGEMDDGKRFAARAEAIARNIQAFMWDGRDGLFYDVDDDGNLVKHKTVAGFWTMLARVATPGQVTRMMRNLRDPDTFWRANPWPALAADQPEYSSDGDYWRGGVWAPTNDMIIEGLRSYPEVPGTQELIREASENYLRNISDVFEQSATIWEFYKPDSDAPGMIWWFLKAHPNFVGWSGIGPIQFLIENILGFRVDAAAHRLSWWIQGTAHRGIRNLRVGTRIVSLEIEPRSHDDDPLRIQTELSPASGNLDLEIVWGGVHYHRSLSAGTNALVLQK